MLPFVKCNIQLDVSQIFQELDSLTWTRHDHNMPTCIIPTKYKTELNKIFKLPSDSYMVIHNLEPLHKMSPAEIPYLAKWHIDTHRESAILIPISIDNSNHYTEFMIDKKVIKVPYSRGVPLLFNVKEVHKVTNTDPVLPRNIIAIGLPNTKFADLVSLYEADQLIDQSCFFDNLFNLVITNV